MFAKKSLGQHFLRNRGALEKIIGAARLLPSDTVLEVGPGEGTLTELLLARAGKVIVVEKDARLVPILEKKFSAEISSGRLKLIHGDILKPDSGFMNHESRFKIVANIPYYITGQFLRTFLQSESQPSMMVLLLQKEVAKRIVAADGKESILSISVKCYGMPEYIGTVKAGSFSPSPKVDSAILKIADISRDCFKHHHPASPTRHPPDLTVVRAGPSSTEEGIMEEKFFEILKSGFAHPRKLLASNLGITKEKLAQCGIAENARAENVSLEDWRCLCCSKSLPAPSLL